MNIEFPITAVGEHSPGVMISRREVDFFCNNETLKIDGGLPFVTEPIVTSYNVPSRGSEKCTMGEKMKGS